MPGRVFRRDMLQPVGSTVSRRFSTISSPLPLPLPLPHRREVHLWYIKPEEINDSSPQLKNYMDLLSPCEKAAVSSLTGHRLQKCAILARTLARTTLSRYYDGTVDPGSIKFRKGLHGKPEIMWQDGDNITKPPIQFNLSHTSSLIACAVALEIPIGIDVEENTRKTANNVLSIARRYFTISEVEHLAAITCPDFQQKEFIRLWTLKEAYVKAIGRGFSGAPFKNFTIKMGSDKRAPKIHIETGSDCEGLTDNCQFALMELNKSHVVAICMERDQEISGNENNLLRLKVWRTIPFIEDELVSGPETLNYICGLT
ncbi:4-phosphopantetheinyl transferase [Rhynchospora pubera]|uniref:holo-[acyl-carrier-protein] synthase n=1 Tax=Rhynchospora pubera TaxID=906938 RepID=A0AAV8E627_9POAL|nr:4-phosphopantetheinyl transferase [Rhynchospora pubera]